MKINYIKQCEQTVTEACSDWRFIGEWMGVSLGMTCNRTFHIFIMNTLNKLIQNIIKIRQKMRRHEEVGKRTDQ